MNGCRLVEVDTFHGNADGHDDRDENDIHQYDEQNDLHGHQFLRYVQVQYSRLIVMPKHWMPEK